MPTVLAVDDFAPGCKMMGHCLRQAGYVVVEAEGGADALTQLHAQRIDLMITDLYMPRMDGIELIKQVRALPSHRLTPILMCTVEDHDGRRADAKAAGASGWIVKPFRLQQLLKVIKCVLC